MNRIYKKHGVSTLIGVVVVIGAVVLYASAYRLDQAEQALILQFGKPVGGTVTEPGLHFHKPFIQNVVRYDKRLMAWDGKPTEIPTAGREFIHVDTYARWRIVDALRFRQRLGDYSTAQSRLDAAIDSAVRGQIAGTELVEIVRSADWQVSTEDLPDTERFAFEGEQESLTAPIREGRERLTRKVLAAAGEALGELGVELVDVRIKRLNYVKDVRRKVYDRMISERQRIAAQFRSEGEAQAQRIEGDTDETVKQIMSEAGRDAEQIRGEGDAKAAAIYSQSYQQAPEFYAFYRTLQSYERSLGKQTVLVIPADSPYFRYLRQLEHEQP